MNIEKSQDEVFEALEFPILSSPKDLAQRFRCSPRTVLTWLRKYKIKVKKAARDVMIPRSEVYRLWKLISRRWDVLPEITPTKPTALAKKKSGGKK